MRLPVEVGESHPHSDSEPLNLSRDREELSRKAVAIATRQGAEFVDARVGAFHVTRFTVTAKECRGASCGIETAFNTRILLDGIQAYCSSTLLNDEELLRRIRNAATYARASKSVRYPKTVFTPLGAISGTWPVRVEVSPTSSSMSEKVDIARVLMSSVNSQAQGRVRTWAKYTDRQGEYVIHTSEGTLIRKEISEVFLTLTAISRVNGTLRILSRNVGGFGGLETLGRKEAFAEAEDLGRVVGESSEQSRCPDSPVTMIFSPSASGALIHEIVGHLCEGDLIVEGESAFVNRLGEEISCDSLTVIDDATIPNMWGSCPFDDEGVPTRKRVLIKSGRLNDFLHTRDTARAFGRTSNACARTDDLRGLPVPRMSNTLVEPGSFPESEMLSMVRAGVYVGEISGGSANTSTGLFQLIGDDLRLVEHGEITKRLPRAFIVANLFDALRNVRAVGKKTGPAMARNGFCLKRNQTLPITFGGPPVLIDNMLLAVE